MTNVKIIKGAYGWRDAATDFIRPKTSGEVCAVSDEEAARLAALGVAEIINAEVNSAETETSTSDLTDMTFNELKALAVERGVYKSTMRSKAALIDALNGGDSE